MKVAVISAVPTCGKTVFMEVLGGVFSRSQGRDVAIFTTGDAKDNMEQVTNLTGNEALDNPYILRAMIQNAGLDAKELLNYGTQAGDEHVFIYNIMGSSMAQEDKEDFLIEAINKIPVDLSLVEITGDLSSPFNQRVLLDCDCSLVLTEQSHRGFRKVAELLSSWSNPKLKYNHAVVISKYDATIAGDKKIASEIGFSINSLYKFPYSSQLAKLAYNGELDLSAYNIIVGDSTLVQFRIPLLEVMQFLFDTPDRKIVRGIDRWYK